MSNALGTAIAFTALGATVVVSGVLLLFNPQSREVRWYVLFQACVTFWLLTLGLVHATGDLATWGSPYAAGVLLMPGFFTAFALVAARARSGALTITVVLAAAAIAAAIGTDLLPSAARIAAFAIWLPGGWIAGSLILWHGHRHELASPGRAPALIVVPLLLTTPVAILGGALFGEAFFEYGMPLVVLGIHALVLVGVARHRFYDIEVRAVRSGELASRAAEAERLAAVGELAAIVAHEVRNPLTGVRSLAQRIAEEDVDPERRGRYAAVILEELARVERIVANLLAVSRHRPEADWSPGPTPLEPLFQDLLLLVQGRAARAGVTIRARAGDVVAPTPREPLAQALLNLLLNSIRHSPPGGTVDLFSSEENGDVIVLVRDAGPGIPPADRDRIFEPFQTGDVAGTGLGLSVVRRLARELGWSIDVDDASGGGAEFRIRMTAREGVPT